MKPATHEISYLSTSVSTGCLATCDCGWTRRCDTHAAALKAGHDHQDEQESR